MELGVRRLPGDARQQYELDDEVDDCSKRSERTSSARARYPVRLEIEADAPSDTELFLADG